MRMHCGGDLLRTGKVAALGCCCGSAVSLHAAAVPAVPARARVSCQDHTACSLLCCRSTLFGPTCDGLDTIVREHPMPALRNGDWVVFPSMGAYSIAGACDFNGFNILGSKFFYVCSEA